jgi:hypothetical protein
MREAALKNSTFPAAQCESCGKTVLTHIAFDDHGVGQRYCIHCDAPVRPPLQWLTADELTAEGYEVGGKAARRGGCGSGCGCAARGN